MSKLQQHEDKQHALLSASGSARWLSCTPSARFEEQFPRQTSTYADEGTAAHELAELYAKFFLEEASVETFEKQLEVFSKNQYFNAEMQEHAEAYATYICRWLYTLKEKCEDAFAELESKKLDFSEWVPEGFGTGDCIIVSDTILEVIDFKYGKGVKVEAENNSQMMLYALGALNRYGALYNIEKIVLRIIQPRVSEIPSSYELAVSELLAWAENTVRPRAKLAFAGEGEFAPSEEACRFCRGKEQCVARTQQNLALFDEPEAKLITPEKAGKILAKAGDIKNWLADLECLVTKTLFEGKEVPGWKLVEGRSNRKYVDEEAVASAMIAAGHMEELLYDRKLLGITAMESAFGKKTVGDILKDLIHKPAGRPTLAPAGDKRKAVMPTTLILEAFNDE